jgi:hypothetical protein
MTSGGCLFTSGRKGGEQGMKWRDGSNDDLTVVTSTRLVRISEYFIFAQSSASRSPQ